MKLFEAEQYIKDQLKKIYEDQEAVNISDLAIEHITGLSRTQRVFKKQQEISKEQIDKLQRNLERLKLHESNINTARSKISQ